jgi:myo-inositol-1(or 4)-monophosphatase
MTALKHKATAISLDADYELLKKAVRDAGALALSFFRQEVTVNKKLDGSEVSEADLAVDARLRQELEGARPDYGWLSEETEDTARRLARSRVWMVDPIDGTNAFLRHIPEWTVSAALVEESEPVIGVVFNPARQEFFHAIKGHGAFLNGRPIHVSGQESLLGAHVIASGGLFKKKIWTEPWPEVETAWVNSVAYRLALVACGRADATISLSTKAEWDLAAGAILVEEAGGLITDQRGDRMVYNRAVPRFPGLVAAPPGLHAAIVERTSRIDRA